MKSKKIFVKLLSVLGLLSFFGIWELVTDVLRLLPPTSLPSPMSVLATFLDKWTVSAPDGTTLGVHILSSLQVAFTGYLLGVAIGVPLGILMGWYKKFDNLASPIFNFMRTIPPLAWIPLMIIVLGIGLKAKAGIVFISAFIPCVINSYSGIKNVSSVHIWVAQTFGATRGEILRGVAIPSALPLIFTGMKISLNSAWTTLVAAEMLGAVSGLGFMMQMGRMYIRPDLIVVGMLCIGLIGLLMSTALDLAEAAFIKGEERKA